MCQIRNPRKKVGNMPRILVVEDYENLQLIYKTALTAAGYTVDVASDGLDALKIADEREPDLILLDLLLPHMGGLEFLREFDLTKHTKTGVIVFSNLYSPNLLEEAKGLGVTHYLTKSDFTPEEMVAMVGKVLHEFGSVKETPAA
jgi:DNA-binding response OmpR family regulator